MVNPFQWAYAAVTGGREQDRRRRPASRVLTADQMLTKRERDQLISSSRDLQNNFSIAAWAVRRHLDYVSSFSFHAKTGNPRLDRELEALIEWASRPLNCDVTSRHSLRSLVRLTEASRVTAGDVFHVKLRSGHLQPIEADRVRNDGVDPDDAWVHGIKLSRAGAALAYAVHRRAGKGKYELDKLVSAGNAYHVGYFDTFDQVRGVSPLTSAINTFVDIYEGFDYALAKAKVQQMFGLVFYRESDWEAGDHSLYDDAETEDAQDNKYDVNFGRGPVKLELEPGDKAEFLESKSPPQEFQAFMQGMISAALKAVDIPYSFYDEAHTNFFGSRAALMHYLKACKSKRQALIDFLNQWAVWRLRLFIANGDLALPRGARISDLKWAWQPDGVPWWNPKEEVTAQEKALALGLTTRAQIRRETHGDDWHDVVRELAAEQELMRELQLTATQSQPTTPEPEENEDEDGTE